jgi:hypothetical protein
VLLERDGQLGVGHEGVHLGAGGVGGGAAARLAVARTTVR